MRAEIICVGTELLVGQIADTNARFLAVQLAELGIDLYYISMVGDNLERAVTTLKQAIERSDLVLVSGGLGPTDDDLTRQALSEATGRGLQLCEAALAEVRAYFTRIGRPMTDINRRQAMLPEGAVHLPNELGTAPGVWLQHGRGHIALMPGVPRELEHMFVHELRKRLPTQSASVLVSRYLRVGEIGESRLQECLGDLMSASNPTLSPYAKLGEVELRLTTKAANQKEAERLAEPVYREIKRRLGAYCYGEGADGLEHVVGEALKRQRVTLAIAESVTGGLLAQRLTAVPGASSYLRAALIAYQTPMKSSLLGVPEHLLSEHGAVSEAVVLAMAEGARARTGADWAVATSGLAGPEGDGSDLPIGLCYWAFVSKELRLARHARLVGGRDEVRSRAALKALWMLWEHLAEEPFPVLS